MSARFFEVLERIDKKVDAAIAKVIERQVRKLERDEIKGRLSGMLIRCHDDSLKPGIRACIEMLVHMDP